MAETAYEVLSPWADADPVPAKAISPRLNHPEGKKIGLLVNSKRAAGPILDVVERKLSQQFPGVTFSRFANLVPNELAVETKEKGWFEDWVKAVDGVVAAVGD
jgi:hypothetical protein